MFYCSYILFKLSYKELQVYKQTLQLSELQREVLIGVLLGDASMGSANGKPVYLIKFEQSIKNQDYIVHLYELFKNYTLKPYIIRLIKRKNSEHQDTMSIWFKTFVHPSFKFYYDLFYTFDYENRKSIKQVPKNIHKFLNVRSLAYWFMDDGNLQESGFSFSTHGFSYKDNQLLQNALKINFNLIVIIRKDKNYYRLYINSDCKELFINLVKPYILPCFLYKLGKI